MEISNKLKKKIERWFNTKKRDYNQGLILMGQCTRNKALLRNLSRHNDHNERKIAWELRKAAGLPEDICLPGAKVKTDTKTKVHAKAKKGSQIPEGKKACERCGKHIDKFPINNKICDKCEFDLKVETYPDIIQEIIKEQGKLFIDRDIYHKELTAIPEENSPDNIKIRKDLRHKLEMISRRIEFLDGHKKAFLEDNKVVPDHNVIYPEPEKDPAPIVDEPRKRLTNLRANRTKKRNRLEYQVTKKLDAPDPMPPGEKRTRIEDDLKAIEKEIAALGKQLGI